MTVCIHHPDRPTRLQCSKHGIYLCEDCARCRDPQLYCKHRTHCPIWFMEKQRKQAAAG